MTLEQQADLFAIEDEYGFLVMNTDRRDGFIAGYTAAEACHAKEIEALKKKAVDRATIAMGAMILDGYDSEDSCVKYAKELIDELKKLTEK